VTPDDPSKICGVLYTGSRRCGSSSRLALWGVLSLYLRERILFSRVIRAGHPILRAVGRGNEERLTHWTF
jgi:hypothetical protein